MYVQKVSMFNRLQQKPNVLRRSFATAVLLIGPAAIAGCGGYDPSAGLIGEKPEPNTVLYASVDCGESSASVAASQASKAVLECAQKDEVPELGKTTFVRPKKFKGSLLKILLSEPAPNGKLSPSQNSNSTTAVVVRGHDNSTVDILNARFV